VKKYPFIIFLAFLIPTTTYAVWYNPATWFSNSNPDNNELLQRVADLEKKLSDKADVTPNVSMEVKNSNNTSTTTISENSKMTSLKAEVSLLENKLNDLQVKYNICSNQIMKNGSINKAVPVAVSTDSNIVQLNKPYDYKNYPEINIKDYVKSPLKWMGWGVDVITVNIVDFIAAGNLEQHNYLLISDATSDSVIPEKMIVEVDDQTDWDNITALKKGALVSVYGIGASSQKFKIGVSDSDSTYYPVIKLQMLSKCTLGGNCGADSTVWVTGRFH
jgi:hypothetical protein